LSGICVRIGQRIGLHKDGSKLGLSVFETEMRRRIWWEVTVLDSTIGHMAGCESHTMPMADTKGPCNTNDSALDPDMKEKPVESSGPTEMIFCLMCYELGVWLSRHENLKTSSFDGLWEFLSSTSISLEHKDKIIDEIESVFETKYIRHCDLSIPIHLVTYVVAKSAVTSVRLRAHHPRQYRDKGLPIPQPERDLLFRLCLNILGYGDLLFSSPKTQKFYWHVDFHFPWDAFIVILLELRHRNTGEDVAKAWQLIDILFRRQYKILNQRKKSALHLAVANLAIKAWSAHVTESERRQINPLPQPQVIGVLWRYVNRGTSSASASTSTSPAPFSSSSSMSNNNTTARSSIPVEQLIIPPSQTPNTTLTGSYLVTQGSDADSHNYNHQNIQSLPLGSRRQQQQQQQQQQQHALYPMMDDENNLSGMNTMYSLDDSPMDWGQWDTLLQQYQEYSTGDTEMIFAPPLV
jgi:Fungal specific transcription factor domain